MHEAPKLVRQEELLNLILLHIPLKECAVRLHVSYGTVRKYASEPDFLNNLHQLSSSLYSEIVEELRTERKSLQQRMLESSDAALTRLEALLNSQQENIALKAADSILDRNSETARNRRVESELHGKFTLDPVMLLHAAATAEELSQTLTNSPGKTKQALPPYEKDGSNEQNEQNG